MDFFTNIIGVGLAVALVVITYFKWSFQYWKKRNVPFLVPEVPFGNMVNPLRKAEFIGVTMQRLYNQMKEKKWKHGGIYMLTNPAYVVLDLDYVKNVLTKDFHHFVDRGVYYNEKDDPLSAHLFTIEGTKWRNLRTKLTPTFTSGKMKMMFHTMVECEANLLKKIDNEYRKKAPIDIKDALGCFTTDIIGSCAFGLECNTFKDEDSPFRRYGKRVFKQTTWRRLLLAFIMNFRKTARFLRIRFMPKEISDFFIKVVEDTVEYREKNQITRRDFLQLLIELKNGEEPLTMKEVAAQSFLFFLAGFETSSTAMTFALYELAKNQDIQNQLREEINTVLKKHGNQVTYEAIQEMKYMNQVLNEALRKYPPVPFLTRSCIKEYKVPDENVIVEKGTRVIIPVFGIHYDQEYYPEPEKFDPERFNDVNTKLRHPYAHIPFGEGPRNCIGLRFGLMQSKVGLTSLLRRYKFTLNQKTVNPIKFQANSFILAVDGDVWLDAEEVS